MRTVEVRYAIAVARAHQVGESNKSELIVVEQLESCPHQELELQCDEIQFQFNNYEQHQER